jgi:hypothetical protein
MQPLLVLLLLVVVAVVSGMWWASLLRQRYQYLTGRGRSWGIFGQPPAAAVITAIGV